MDTRRLGRTGHHSTVAILGGAAFARSNPQETAAAFTTAVANGVNHLDIAPQYGAAETLVGPLLPSVRDKLFVACKTLRKNPGGVRAQLSESLEKLNTDHFDLYQLHAVTSLDVLEERTEAAEAILAARDEGLTRFVGITGHDDGAPAAHLEALKRFDLDTVMFPVNARMWSQADYRRDAEALLAFCAEHDVGVMAIKACARRPWPSGQPSDERAHTTWYEPFADAASVQRGVDFTLSVPGVHAFCTPGDVEVLQLAVDAATKHQPMDSAAREAAMAEAADERSIFPLGA
jgi:aryl-alcohol dehydrogenase-like predicted oxidoreductase